HNRARVLAVHDDTEENQVWRWRRGGWRGDLYDWRRRRRRWRRGFSAGRKERTIKRRRQLVQGLSGNWISKRRGWPLLLVGDCGVAAARGFAVRSATFQNRRRFRHVVAFRDYLIRRIRDGRRFKSD